ncbi:MAG TPA: hypothetical protein V6D29_20310 [Leptolyngbyaceae cyanobacterium]
MKDSTAFVAGCAAAGALVLLMLLTRSGAGRISDTAQSPQESSLPAVQTIPVAPPQTTYSDPSREQEFQRELERQKDLTAELKSQIERQQALTEDLRAQMARQEDDTQAILSELRNYQQSMDAIATQQTRLAESIPQANDNQSVLLWGVVGLFLLLLIGGGAVLTVFTIWLLQSQRQQQRRTTVMYPVHMPNPYPSYEYQALPPVSRPQRVVQYDVQDYAD